MTGITKDIEIKYFDEEDQIQTGMVTIKKLKTRERNKIRMETVEFVKMHNNKGEEYLHKTENVPRQNELAVFRSVIKAPFSWETEDVLDKLTLTSFDTISNMVFSFNVLDETKKKDLKEPLEKEVESETKK